jgi:tetratricopeptide (TPR) repeat protein
VLENLLSRSSFIFHFAWFKSIVPFLFWTDYSAELHAKAKFNIGLEYKKKNLYQRAIENFEEINQEYSKLYFAAASYQKGIILNYIYNNFEDALKLWNNIKIEDTKEGFAAAQYHIAKVYETKKDNYIKALEYLNKINKDDFLNFYNLAILNIANIKAYKFNEYKEAIIVLSNLSEKTEDDIRIKADYLLGKLHF